MEQWACDNSCGMIGGAGEFFQMSSEDDDLMLVCGDCVYDPFFQEWNVDFEGDPRGVTYTLDNLTLLNGVVTR